MNIGKYIHELLLEHETVIIPGFGAFISSYKSAEINEETGEMNPPSKEIVFNAQIRNNDGLLVGSIAEGEGISHFDALREIEKERENIIYHLDKEGKFILEETGKLYHGEDNEILFKPVPDKNLLLDSFGLDAVSLEPEEDELPVEEESITEPPVEMQEDHTETDDTNEAMEEIELTGGQDEETTADKEDKEGTEGETEKELEDPVVFQEPHEHEEEEPAVAQVTYTDFKSDSYEKEDRKKKSWWWLLFILIPVIGVGIYITFQKPVNIDTAGNDDINAEQNEPVVVLDTTEQDSVITSAGDTSVLSEIVKDTTETIILASPRFYLIGGSFKAEENAETYLQQLKKEGFEPFHLGKYGNFYVVGIGKYDTEEEAMDAKKAFNSKSPESGIWILEK